MIWIALAAVGGVGAVARFWLDATVQARAGREFPLGTLAVNVSGSFALGLLTGLHVTGTTAFVVGTGFLGSFTTFSTWVFEAHRLSEDGELALSVSTLLVGLAGGLTAAAAGWALGAL